MNEDQNIQHENIEKKNPKSENENENISQDQQLTSEKNLNSKLNYGSPPSSRSSS